MKTDCNKWQYKPEFTTADTSSISNLYCTTTSTGSDEYIAAEINRRVNEIYKEHETKMTSVKFNELAKDLEKLGVELETIRHAAGNKGCEIEGYFYPEKYTTHRGRKRCMVPITPKKPLPKKVIFSGPATTILWTDGTKTTVRCSSEDVWEDEVGIAMCYLKKMLGNKGNYNNIFREAMKVAVTQELKDRNAKTIDINNAKTIDINSYTSSAFTNMSDNIDKINKCMKDVADALSKVTKEKK